jgi:hypothetical protein
LQPTTFFVYGILKLLGLAIQDVSLTISII